LWILVQKYIAKTPSSLLTHQLELILLQSYVVN